MDTTKTTTHIGLCAGYGGIELGLKRVIPNLRSVALCEIEAFACANLVAKMEAGLMEPAPIWTDLKSFPWESFRDRVDILTGGYPCQPFSAAGKRLGTEDPRHLWPYIASGIRILRPKLCFFENVEGHISLGLREVIGELESMGYKVSWGIFSAREVGAPHQRKRVFILADREGERLPQFANIRAVWREVCSTSISGQLANGNEQRLERGIQQGVSPKEKQNEFIAGYGGTLADSNGAGSWEDRESGKPRADCIEQSSVIEGRSESGQIREGQAWPSRPGEPQHAWEPPRVVGGSMANSNISEQSEERGDDGEVPQIPAGEWTNECATLSGGEGELNGEEVLGNSSTEGLQRCGTSSEMDRKSGGAEGEGSESTPSIALSSDAHGGEVVENSVIVGRGGRSDGDAGGLRGEIQTAGSRCGREQISETQPSLGRDADGPADRMDYAELQVSCDNRTDELRLLGNGVVPATAERAFRTLLDELNT